ncbi:MAG: hypothetical protein WA842_11945 [Croceibacterium sp.]
MLVLPAPALAQDSAPPPASPAQASPEQASPAQEGEAAPSPALLTAEQALERASALYAVRVPRADPCPPQKAGEIVVCRRLEDPESLRVPSPTDDAIANGQAVGDGVPRAPDLFGIPGNGVSIGFGSVPPPALMIDLKAIPEPPAGSDAAAYGYDEYGDPVAAPAAPPAGN